MSPSENELYEDHVMDHYEDPYHRGECSHQTHSFEANNPLCGDVVRVQLRMSPGGKIDEAWFDGSGCVISQASASMLMEKIEGMTTEEIKNFSAEEMLRLFGPRLTPNRQKCCLLGWRVLQSAIHAPVDENGSPSFGGPSLGDEI